jgi:hypothetical protein
MKKGFLAVGLLVALLAMGACAKDNNTLTGGKPAKSAKPCDRACLEGFVDQYLAALASHNASQLQLAENARYNENGRKQIIMPHIKVENKNITRIETIGIEVPYGMLSGWRKGA